MTTTNDSVEELIRRCWNAPYGTGQIALAEEAITQADALGELALRFDARMAATTAYQYGGEPAKGFVTFSWCLAQHDAHPDLFGGSEHLLLWYFKYMINSLTRFPEVPLARTYAVLDDMQRRYQEGGHSLQAVYKHRWLVATHVGDVTGAARYYEQWQTAQRDNNSDCRGCDPTDQVYHLASLGRDEEAIALTGSVLSGQLTCVEQPQEILTALLLPYLRTGRLEEARHAHHRAYRAIRGQRSKLATLADHLYFLGVSGNEVRGLELIERHISWLDTAPTPHAEMEFLAAAAMVLRRLNAKGYGAQTVHGSSIATLGEGFTKRAITRAAMFDRRNGTTRQSERITAWLDAESIVEYLPLSLTVAVTQAPVKAEKSVELDPLSDVEQDAPLDLLLDLAEEALRQDQQPRVEALWLRVGVHEPSTVLQSGRLADFAGMRQHPEPPEYTEEQWLEALRCYLEAADEIREHRTRGRLGLHRCRNGDIESGLEQVRASTAYLLKEGSPQDQAGGLRRLAVALLHAEQASECLGVLDELESIAEPDPGPKVRLQVMLLRTQALGAYGQISDAVDRAQRLVDQARIDGEMELVALGEFFLGQGLSLMEHVDLAVAAYERALNLQTLSSDLNVEIRERRAILLAGSARSSEVVDDLVALVARLTEGGHDDADQARFHLAVALLNAGRVNDSAEVGEEALYGAVRAEDLGMADQVRALLATVYQRLDEPDQALSYLDELAANLDGFDNAGSRAQVLEQAGEILFDLDRDTDAAARLSGAATAYEMASLPLDQIRVLRRAAVATMFGSDADSALAVLASADLVGSGLSGDTPEAEYELAWLALDGARVLAGVGMAEEALTRVHAVPGRFRELQSYGEAYLAELSLGEVLLTLSRPEDAEKPLRSVVNGLPRDAATLPRAAYALAFALAQQDKMAEAEKLAERYGFNLE